MLSDITEDELKKFFWDTGIKDGTIILVPVERTLKGIEVFFCLKIEQTNYEK